MNPSFKKYWREMRGTVYEKKKTNNKTKTNKKKPNKRTMRKKPYKSVVQMFCKSHQVILFQSICCAGH